VTDFESRRAHWLSVDRALERIVASVEPGPVERLPLIDALGRALAEPIVARGTLPPWDNSAMDGYAVRAGDVRGAGPGRPVRLRVSGVAMAGGPAAEQVVEGTAVRIMTGAAVPPGADTVIRVEDTDREAGEAGRVEVRSDRDAGRNVRPGGQDMRAGEVVLDRGSALGPGALAVAAAAGRAWVDVHRTPRVAVLSTGDELLTLEAWEASPGEGIPDTNGLMLAAAVAAAGGEALPPRLARDSRESIGSHLEACRHADVLVTSGGASMGEADLLKRVLDDLGFALEFWRVTLRPGSPFSFGFLPRDDAPPLPVFGLPGNPASAFVTFELFVRPFLLRRAGHRRIYRPVLRAVAEEAFPSSEGLTHYHRVVIEDGGGIPRARLTGAQGSGLVQSLGRAHGLAVVPLGVQRIDPGDAVEVILLHDGPGASEVPGYRTVLA
jgi:molybdopterin molybdotransferase